MARIPSGGSHLEGPAFPTPWSARSTFSHVPVGEIRKAHPFGYRSYLIVAPAFIVKRVIGAADGGDPSTNLIRRLQTEK